MVSQVGVDFAWYPALGFNTQRPGKDYIFPESKGNSINISSIGEQPSVRISQRALQSCRSLLSARSIAQQKHK